MARQLEDRADALLWTVRHCSVVAAVGTAGDVGREQLHQRLARLTHDGRVLALGVGDRAEGRAETRQSYAEASDALQVGPHVTHNPQPVYKHRDLAPVIALRHADRGYILEKGRCRAEGPREQLSSGSALRTYLGVGGDGHWVEQTIRGSPHE
jgi:sugar diacid utilization regulator